MEQRLIDANALIKAICSNCALFLDKTCDGNRISCYPSSMVWEQPTVDAVPVSYIYKRAMELKNDDMIYAYTVLNSLIANYRADGEKKDDGN